MPVWPFARFATATPASPVLSNLLNAIQDEMVRRASGVIVLPAYAFIGPGVSAYNAPPISAAVNGSFFAPIPSFEGMRALSMTYARFGNGVADLTLVQLVKTTAAGATSNLINTTDVNPAAAWADAANNVGAPVALAAGETLAFAANANAAGISMGNLRIAWDRP